MKTDLTVVICTHNREQLLSRALASLNRAVRPPGRPIDILVVPNACRDGTASLLDGYQREQERHGWLSLRYEAEPRPGKSHALNRAIRLLDSEVVAYVDDDHRVDEMFLASILEAADDYPDIELFCGRILPDWDGSEPPWVHEVGPYRIYPLPVPRYDRGPEPGPLARDGGLPGGGNLFLRRSIFTRVGGFSVDFGPHGHDLGGGEDTEWLERALAAGAGIQYVPSVVQYHYVDGSRLTLPYLLRKAYGRSSSVIRLDRDQAGAGAVPLYMFRKVASYLADALTSRSADARRFFLVRIAAALGEIDGAVRRRRI